MSDHVSIKGGPNPIDVHVGERVRQRRKFLKLSQGVLANTLDITFQQVQKYERGSNRISASMLHGIAKILRVPISYFFQGLTVQGENQGEDGEFSESASEATIHEFLKTAEGIEIAAHFPKIANPKLRRRVLELVQSLAAE